VYVNQVHCEQKVCTQLTKIWSFDGLVDPLLLIASLPVLMYSGPGVQYPYLPMIRVEMFFFYPTGLSFASPESMSSGFIPRQEGC
jgi:hypothetical protein